MFENEKVENEGTGATVFLHKLAIALIQTGAGTGIIKDEVADFIRRCYISGIEFDVSIKEDITNGKEKED